MDTERWMLDTIEFDRSVALAQAFAAKHGNTLVIVTADHEVAGTALIGVILLGWGSMTSLGCTIGVLLSGTQAFALSGWVFFAFAFLGSFVGIKLKFHTTG